VRCLSAPKGYYNKSTEHCKRSADLIDYRMTIIYTSLLAFSDVGGVLHRVRILVPCSIVVRWRVYVSGPERMRCSCGCWVWVAGASPGRRNVRVGRRDDYFASQQPVSLVHQLKLGEQFRGNSDYSNNGIKISPSSSSLFSSSHCYSSYLAVALILIRFVNVSINRFKPAIFVTPQTILQSRMNPIALEAITDASFRNENFFTS
jgi:hypothetical protein